MIALIQRVPSLPGDTMKHLFILSCFFLLFMVGSGCDSRNENPPCTDPLGCVQIGPDQPVLIGVLQALSGEIAPLGQDQIRGLSLIHI